MAACVMAVDASVEALAATPHRFGAGGIRSADMALRFKYAGIEAWSEQDDRRASSAWRMRRRRVRWCI